MALTINTNVASLLVQKNLEAATSSLNTAIERMTTGFKINSAKDDAAGMAVAIKLDTQLSSYDVASQNVAMGSSLLTTVEENEELVLGHLQRIRDLAEQAANGAYSTDSKAAIAAEIDSRVAEINRLSESVEFNGIKLLDGSKTSLNIQVGINGGDVIDIGGSMGSTSATALLGGTYGGTAAGTEIVDGVSDTATAADVLTAVDGAINTIKDRITKIGAFQNRLDSAAESIEVAQTNITSALSTVRDADVSTESSNYIKAQILQQASATLLTTANQTPSIALNLL